MHIFFQIYFFPGQKGQLLALGSNSGGLRVFPLPPIISLSPLSSSSSSSSPSSSSSSSSILATRKKKQRRILRPHLAGVFPKLHLGSVYSLAWASGVDLIATGSNDKSIKVVKLPPQLREERRQEEEEDEEEEEEEEDDERRGTGRKRVRGRGGVTKVSSAAAAAAAAGASALTFRGSRMGGHTGTGAGG